jgi:hypothetical protein
MASPPNDQHGEANGSVALTNFDPQLVEILRAALVVLAQEQKQKDTHVVAVQEEKKEKKPDESMPFFWKVCTAALLSIATLVSVTLYNQLNASSAQVRSDLGQVRGDLNQLRDKLVPADDYQQHKKETIDEIKEAQARQKASADLNRKLLEDQEKYADDLRNQIRLLEAEMRTHRDRLSTLEARQREATQPGEPLPRSKIP